MLIKIKRDSTGKFIPTPREELLKAMEYDRVENVRQNAGPTTNKSIFELALEGHKLCEESQSK